MHYVTHWINFLDSFLTLDLLVLSEWVFAYVWYKFPGKYLYNSLDIDHHNDKQNVWNIIVFVDSIYGCRCATGQDELHVWG